MWNSKKQLATELITFLTRFQDILLGLGLFILGFLLNLTRPPHLGDESWFLQVLNRASTDEVLYKDIFLGVTPLSVYITGLFTSLLGMELLVLRSVVVLCYVLLTLIGIRILRQLQLPNHYQWMLVLILLVYTNPTVLGAGKTYTPLATLFLLCAFSAMLAYRRVTQTPDDRLGKGRGFSLASITFAAAGLLAGLAFAAKQNIGVYALAMVLAILVFTQIWNRSKVGNNLGQTAVVLAVFTATVGAWLLPVMLNGGMEMLLDYGFLNKGTYLEAGSGGIADKYVGIISLLIPPWTGKDLRQLYWHTRYLIPVLAFLAVLYYLYRGPSHTRRTTLTVLVLLGAAVLIAFPRAGPTHVAATLPAMSIGLLYIWHNLSLRFSSVIRRVVVVFILAWLGIGVVKIVGKSIYTFSSSKYRSSDIPHFRGVLIEQNRYAELSRNIRALRESAERAGTSSPFLLSPRAGFYYLTTGLSNPTPIDYPLVTAFGLQGRQNIENAIIDGVIDMVTIEEDVGWSNIALKPQGLIEFVSSHMVQVEDLGFYKVYRQP